MMAISKLLIFLFVAISTFGNAQFVKSGKISYERKTNLLKKFDDERMRRFIKEENKITVDRFNLFFTDSSSLFAYSPPETEDPMSFLTTKNTVYQNFNQNKREVFMDMFGSQIIIGDSLYPRVWKITDKSRKIAGYECTRAIWQKDDSTRIYAWFTPEILPNVGPESIKGLPGAILGLATEDGGVVFFATKVEPLDPTPEQMNVPKKKGKELTEEELRIKMTAEMKGQPFGDQVLRELFFW